MPQYLHYCSAVLGRSVTLLLGRQLLHKLLWIRQRFGGPPVDLAHAPPARLLPARIAQPQLRVLVAVSIHSRLAHAS